MASLTIHDLPLNQALDAKAMSCIRGSAGAPWVYGWIAPFNPDAGNGRIAVFNFYQITNNFFANQMINQFQTVNVNNTAPSSNINVGLDERSTNVKN
jgi:hypothetical protein